MSVKKMVGTFYFTSRTFVSTEDKVENRTINKIPSRNCKKRGEIVVSTLISSYLFFRNTSTFHACFTNSGKSNIIDRKSVV